MESNPDYSKIGLSIPFNWDKHLINKLGELNRESDNQLSVSQIYGSDPFSITGSGRAGNTLAKREFDFKFYIDQAHKNGIQFNYLWNVISMGGAEWSLDKKLYKQAKNLVESGVDCITVAIPLLALKLKNWFPELKISCSVNNKIDSVEKVHQLKTYFNVDRIIVDHRCSRNINLIKTIHREFPDTSLSVLVNESCLPDCILQVSHQYYLAQISRENALLSFNPPDLCHNLCGITKLSDPLYVLKSPWVPPQDIHYLTEAGISLIKLAGRTKDSEWILKLARIYAKGKFEGNIWPFIEKSGLRSKEWDSYLGKELEPCHYKVENHLLKGFFIPFVNGTVPCVQNSTGCGNCKWCSRWMQAVSYPTNGRERLDDLKQLLENTVSKHQLPKNCYPTNQLTTAL